MSLLDRIVKGDGKRRQSRLASLKHYGVRVWRGALPVIERHSKNSSSTFLMVNVAELDAHLSWWMREIRISVVRGSVPDVARQLFMSWFFT